MPTKRTFVTALPRAAKAVVSHPLTSRCFSVSCASRKSTKVVQTADDALNGVRSGATILCGGFGLCGIPETLINAVLARPDITGLTVVSNNAGTDNHGLSRLIKSGQIRKMISSYIGDNKTFENAYLKGQIEVELTPQGTLAERCAAGARGIPAFYTPTAFGTMVQTGELPSRHHDGVPVEFTKPKAVGIFDGKPYLLEEAIRGDVAFVKAYRADTQGNCQFRLAANNFNGPMGRNSRLTIVEAEEIVEPGAIPPEAVHLPGIYVKRVMKSVEEKKIDKLTLASQGDMTLDPTNARARIARRAAQEFRDGMHVNLGIGIPMLATTFASPDIEVQLHSENGVLGLGPYPERGHEDPDLINAGKETVTLKPCASVFSSDESFGMIRSGRIDLTILGGMQVSSTGDLANWAVPGEIKGFGGAMDLVSNPSATKVLVTMEHMDRKGRPKIVGSCTLPLTGKACVTRIITDLAVFDVDASKGLTLVELAPGRSVGEIQTKTGAPFTVSDTLKEME